MKKIFTLLASSLFSFSLFAYTGSRLSISSANYTMKLRIEVDGQQVVMQANRAILNNLSEGNHNIRIYREKRRDDFDKTGFAEKYEIIYATSVYIGEAYQVDVAINQAGRVQVDSYSIKPDDYCSYETSDPIASGSDNVYNYITTGQEIDIAKHQLCKKISGTVNK